MLSLLLVERSRSLKGESVPISWENKSMSTYLVGVFVHLVSDGVLGSSGAGSERSISVLRNFYKVD